MRESFDDVKEVIIRTFDQGGEWTHTEDKTAYEMMLTYQGRTWTITLNGTNVTILQPDGTNVMYTTLDEINNAMIHLRQDPHITLTWDEGRWGPVHGPENRHHTLEK